ncbi:MAG: cobalamin B12-binding domain-containing protein [Chloroflexi bacterium]|nr:cobalamin B12-binding domain-containing protein [Chloroflexota bacterium]
MKNKKIRVLLTKVGLDGHNWGVLAVAMALRDAGMEVIYLGRHVKPEQIAKVAVEEGVDIVGLSSLSDAHRVLAPRVVSLIREKGCNAPVILGGFVQPEDVPELKQNGIAEVFGIQTRFEDIISWIRENGGGKGNREM